MKSMLPGKRTAFLFILIGVNGLILASEKPKRQPAIIPKPVQETYRQGTFTLTPETKIACSARDKELQNIAGYLNMRFEKVAGFTLQVVDDNMLPKSNYIHLSLELSGTLDREGYTLDVTHGRIRIAGGQPAGVFYAVQSFLQLLPPEIYGGEVRNDITWSAPSVSVSDKPRFQWRGMHLDVCRHFFPKEFVKKYIDFLAMYKMNTFHWHLTDDQGWRIEIRKYPKLTEIGAWRDGSMVGPYYDLKFDSIRYGGFYTQEDIKEIVAYAASRYITVVPEIEMPGHSLAALASFPELSCNGGPFKVGKAWGVYDDVFCPKESTFTFLEQILTEVCELFPGKYVHIGGDECPKVRWKACSHCQALMKREGLKDEHELQSYFIRRIEKFLNAKGKQIIGWDEILEGGLAPNAAVMSWRGTEGGIAAARQHHYVVMSPGSHCYFDHYQANPKNEPLAIGGYTTVEKVYWYEPVPSVLSRTQRKFIMGAQGNLWTEYIHTPEHVEYMAMPRMAALAEVVWSLPKHRDYQKFQRRLLRHFKALDQLNVNYSKALFDIQSSVKANPAGNGVRLALSSPFGAAGIRYTLDGSEPGKNSPIYKSPINITNATTVRFAYVDGDTRRGKIAEQQFTVTYSTGKKITLKKSPDKSYYNSGPFTLVDGIRGDVTRFGKDWLGFWGPNLEAVIDLKQPKNVSGVTLGVFNSDVSWIYFPKSIEVLLSDDGLKFVSAKKIAVQDTAHGGKSVEIDLGPRTARFVKVIAVNAGKIPDGKPGAGNNSWLFVDEIMVK